MKPQFLKTVPLIVLLGIAFVTPGVTAAGSPNDILIIVNKSVSAKAMTSAEAKQIFLKRKSSWSNGNKIVCINAQNNSTLRQQFRESVLDMTGEEESTYWEKQKIKNQLSAPTELGSRLKAVFKLKNAISYAYRKDVRSNVVKVLLVIPKT